MHTMQKATWVETHQITNQLRSLFRSDDPFFRRCLGVLEGSHPGKIFTDDASNPTWGVVSEEYDGATFFGGEIDSETIEESINSLRHDSELVVGMWTDDPRWALVPETFYYDGFCIDFFERPIGQGLQQYLQNVPEDCVVRRLDRDLIMRTQWGPDDVQFQGGLDEWERTCIGYCLMQGDEILCESTAGPPAGNVREPGVITHADHRGRGYATITAAHLVHEIESRAEETFWSCNKNNVASAKIGRKLGYTVEKEYRIVAWGKVTQI